MTDKTDITLLTISDYRKNKINTIKAVIQLFCFYPEIFLILINPVKF